MKRILVTGAGGNASLSFVASLRMAPEPFHVVGTDTNPYHLECAPVDVRYRLPRCDEAGYLDALREVVARERVELIHPQPDVEVAFLSAHRDVLPAATFLPSDEAVRLCHDKARCNDALRTAGVPVPESYRVTSLPAVQELVARLRGRGETVWVRAVRGAGSRAALPVRTARQAQDWMHYWQSMRGLAAEDFMLAEYLPGREFAFQSLWHEGRLVTSMARERREYLFGNLMPSGQSSSPSIAVTVHRQDVNDVAARAVRAVDRRPHGVYCVDLKENAEGVPSVTEINIGRFFTTSNFFSAAGSNMPYLYAKLAFGEAIPAQPAFDAVEAGLYWVRGVDREPTMLRSEPWTAKRTG